MDPDLAALKVAIEAASPGTPSLPFLRIADVVAVVLREARAEAWDEGWEARDAQRYQTSNPYDQ